MPDEPTTDAPQDDADKSEQPDKDLDWKAEADKWKALARKHEGQAKANSTAAQRLKELEDADKSEVEKARNLVNTEKARADAAEAKALRYEIAAEKGLTPSMVKRLVGTTKEELEADADELLSAFSPTTDDKREDKSRRPKEKLRPGASSQEEPDANPSKVADDILSRPF